LLEAAVDAARRPPSPPLTQRSSSPANVMYGGFSFFRILNR